MADELTATECAVLLAVLDESLTGEALTSAIGSDALSAAESLAARGVLHVSARGNYKVPLKSRPCALSLLGEDAPAPPILEVFSDSMSRTHVEFFNGVGDVRTYRAMLQDGIHGAREADASTVMRIRPGDLMLNYITEPYSEWICIQRVVDFPYRSTPHLHGLDDLPLRIPVEVIAALEPGKGLGRVQAADMAHQLGGRAAAYRHSPKRVDPVAARAIIGAILDTHRRKGSIVATVDLEPEYLSLIGS